VRPNASGASVYVALRFQELVIFFALSFRISRVDLLWNGNVSPRIGY
jgi:hypothetical protein